jgi:hypothetical protein
MTWKNDPRRPITSRSEDKSGTRVFHSCEASLQEQLITLLDNAFLAGFVITVELKPFEPLAMGNYRMVGHVRGGR